MAAADGGRLNVPGAAAALSDWLEAIAAPDAAPAGGAAAALATALAGAAVELVARLTLERERYAAVHPRAREAAREAARLRQDLVTLAVRDAEAFAEFGRALALPRSTGAERDTREKAKRVALRLGAELQVELLRAADRVTSLAAELAEHGLATALGDAATAGLLAAGAGRSAYWAARVNLGAVEGEDGVPELLEEGSSLLGRIEEAEARIRGLAAERIR